MPGNSANRPELVATPGFDYYELAPCLATCPADYQARFTLVPQIRPRHASSWIVSFIAAVPANAVAECFEACSTTYSCLSFTVVTDVYSSNYGKCQLYTKAYRNPTFQTVATFKDLR